MSLQQLTSSPAHAAPLLQAIFDLARAVDPAGQRTLGVLTKPDQIETATEAQWSAMFNNHSPKFKLELGYFAVRNPPQKELNEGWAPCLGAGPDAWTLLLRNDWHATAHGATGG
jgi:hypothetical protein